jgi:hypothetical protein
MNRKKLWLGWAVNGVFCLIFLGFGMPSVAIAEMTVCAVLGWLAVATPKDSG